MTRTRAAGARVATFAALVAALAAAVPARATLHLIGDSTMAERADSANPERGWGELLPRFVHGVDVRNHAVNGRSTRSFLAEGRWEAVRAQLRHGDYVLVQFGHNDEKREDSTRYAEAGTTYRANLERFVRETRAAGATPVLLTPIVRRKFDVTGSLLDTHGEYAPVVREVARAERVPLVDLEAMTREMVVAAGPERSKRWFVWLAPGESAWFPVGRQDDTHLSRDGAAAVASLAARAIAVAVPSLAPHVREHP